MYLYLAEGVMLWGTCKILDKTGSLVGPFIKYGWTNRQGDEVQGFQLTQSQLLKSKSCKTRERTSSIVGMSSK
jgi:hypothetical protein